jgi:copper(I)-binding protein
LEIIMINRHPGLSSLDFYSSLTLACVGAATAHDTKTGDLTVSAPYARAMLPGAKVGGGYLSITNAGAADRLVGATSDRAASVQIHEMKMEGGIMIMREIKGGVPVPASGVLELKPGGYHLMFMNVPKPFKQGETVRAILTFERAGSVEIPLTVGAAAGGAPDMDHADKSPADGHGEHQK